MNDTFEKRLELIMGPSRDIILEGVEDTDTMDRICKDNLGYKKFEREVGKYSLSWKVFFLRWKVFNVRKF